MLGDVWLEETKDGKVERKDITDRFSNDKDKIQTQTNNKG